MLLNKHYVNGINNIEINVALKYKATLMSPLRCIGYELKLKGVVIKEKLFFVCLN